MKKYLILLIVPVLIGSAVFAWLQRDDARIERAIQAAEAVLFRNPDGMTALAEELLRCETDGRHLQYYPKKNELYLFDEASIAPREQLKEHTVLDAAQFLAGDRTFFVVASCRSNYAVAASHCEFSKAVTDWKGKDLFILRLIYCPEPFEENRYAPLEELLPNWYLYLMPCV